MTTSSNKKILSEKTSNAKIINTQKLISKEKKPHNNPLELLYEDVKKEWAEKFINKISSPNFIKKNGNIIDMEDEEGGLAYVKLYKSTGCAKPSLGLLLAAKTADTVFKRDDIQKLNDCIKFMNAFNPQNEIEGILVSQMVGTYNLAMEFMRRSMSEHQYIDNIETNTKLSIKLMSLFTKQIETLERLRGKTGNQKVTVEHVYVNAGGQAIVGNVETPGGSGDKKKE